jgi:hypothetical protein
MPKDEFCACGQAYDVSLTILMWERGGGNRTANTGTFRLCRSCFNRFPTEISPLLSVCLEQRIADAAERLRKANAPTEHLSAVHSG